MKQKFVILTLAGFLMFSCVSNKDSGGTNDIIIDSLTSKLFISDSILIHPIAMNVTDKEIVLVNFNSADTLINVFGLDGKPISSFLTKGNGPKEALWIPNIHYNSIDNSLYASDINKQCIFHITDYLSKVPKIEVIIPRKSESDSIILQGQIVRLANGKFVATNTTPEGMLAEFDYSGTFIETHIPFPDKSKIDERLADWANADLYYPDLKVSPDGKFAVVTYDTSDMKIFITVDENEIIYNIIEGSIPNDIYLSTIDSNLMQGFATKKTKIYNQDLSLSDQYAYQLYIGITKEEISETDFFKDTKHNGSNTVKVYDREGNHVKTIILDRWASALAVSPDDKYLYTLTESSEEGYTVLRYEL
ncbi:MAG: hypothetical protein K2M11_03345 [Paramuribaculum sp.]|nr:hypothetical protein [Paramuribaculum sp.]